MDQVGQKVALPGGRPWDPVASPAPCRCDLARHIDQAVDVPRVADERRQAELAMDTSCSFHQDGAVIHSLLDRAEGVFATGAMLIEGFGTGGQPRGHAVKHGLVLQTSDLPVGPDAARSELAGQAGLAAAGFDLYAVP
ncbi:hypothetical protein FHG71_14920 [Rubellimicrobium roseum]|uniref:Uncharacterized protein n=1 Tax=Rubellimicrobium roseum TaxID=687525 RepID=A0A5C4NEC5_9RHOB|nr:hypothetical protein [Rubellimicrobium roseum]TNC68274.1 hypothetical protein FHG71_14920 [Rubellimicrobium roseum]